MGAANNRSRWLVLQNRNELAEHWEHVAKVPQELASGAFADDDDVVAVDLRILEAARADVLKAEQRRDLLVADGPEDHDVVEVGGLSAPRAVAIAC